MGLIVGLVISEISVVIAAIKSRQTYIEYAPYKKKSDVVITWIIWIHTKIKNNIIKYNKQQVQCIVHNFFNQVLIFKKRHHRHYLVQIS